MITARRNVLAGGALLVVLMGITFVPFASLFTTALHADHPLVRDHRIDGRPILCGAALIEMALAAGLGGINR